MGKVTCFRIVLLAVGLALATVKGIPEPARSVYDFPIYKNRPSGPQVGGQHAPASTPALDPIEAQQRFRLPAGFEIRLFAAEPAVVNPVAMDWDERGRLWVLELYEYPMGAAPGTTPRDRIKILEDTDGDGRADKVHVWADGLNLATGLLLGHGGAYVGQAPDLLFLQDTTNNDLADRRHAVMTGFGLEDRHELLNGFTWGPDGYLYMTHGVFTYSTVRDPDDPEDDGVLMNAAVARWHPRSRRFEVFADGTSNPWGVDFDRHGNAFVSACVIDHLFHMAPGGSYVRQAGRPAFPYAYELLPSIVDHRHHMAAYCGVQVYLGDQYPPAYLDTILMGNIHDNSVHIDRLTPNGSSFHASHHEDLVRTDDGWFRPVVQKVGPDGAVWIADWYDKYPCYQNALADPDGVDREYGRIWRVVHVGDQSAKPVPTRPTPDMDLRQLSNGQLISLLKHPNIWHRKQAQRLLHERPDPILRPQLLELLEPHHGSEARLFALWTLYTTELLDEPTLDRLVADADPSIRAWVARLTGERNDPNESASHRLLMLADDSNPSVRLAVGTAVRQFTSGSLTVNTPPRGAGLDPRPILDRLIRASHLEPDPLIPFMIWLAAEPTVVTNIHDTLQWFASDGGQYLPLTGTLVSKLMRRLCDLDIPAHVDLAVQFLDAVADPHPLLAVAALDGLLEGQRGRPLLPRIDAYTVLERLGRHSDVPLGERARQLAALWGDATALAASLELVLDRTASESSRLRAIESVRGHSTEAAGSALLDLLDQAPPHALAVAALRALGGMGGDRIPDSLFQRWNRFTPALRLEAANVLVTRASWIPTLLSALEQKRIPTGDIPATAIRAILQTRTDSGRLARRAEAIFGRVRDADATKLGLIAEKRQVALTGPPNFERGRELAVTLCLVCHTLHGEGTVVGPDLTGVGRSSLDALLVNIIDPNQIIGQGYENVTVDTRDGRTLSGRLIDETDTRITLINVGGAEIVIAKDDIESRTVSDLSLMPEGLEQIPDHDFRDLVWYILAPPQEGVLTPERRRELIGNPAQLVR
jgi:putative membrane-bound dehydrogenase-like protein